MKPFASPLPNRAHRLGRRASIWAYTALLAWAPFPLGGAISWGAGLQEILIALCWAGWMLASAGRLDISWRNLRLVLPALVLGAAVLGWACVQMLPVVPAHWANPVWQMMSQITGRPVAGTISINPWHTQAEILKLASSLMACWLVFAMALRTEAAAHLLNAVIVIGAVYALYGFALAVTGMDQTALFYALPWHSSLVSGPFMLHNSFATYCGLASVAAIAKLFALGHQNVSTDRGMRHFVLTLIQFAVGRSAPLVIAALLCFSGVVASASRAGFAATMCGLLGLALASLLVAGRGRMRMWTGAGVLAAILPLLVLVVWSGGTLDVRVAQLMDSGVTDTIRSALRVAALRMIADAPLLGLGLGTFQDAYPLYASQVFALVMDKAHCDYLEFAAGLGLPAACAWWGALAWLFALCLGGVWRRRRNRLYPLVAVGATVLVAVHSSVDFSLQIPAVALSYATLLALGVAQAFPKADTPRAVLATAATL